MYHVKRPDVSTVSVFSHVLYVKGILTAQVSLWSSWECRAMTMWVSQTATVCVCVYGWIWQVHGGATFSSPWLRLFNSSVKVSFVSQNISLQWQSTHSADLTELNWQVMRSRQCGDYSGLCSDTRSLQWRLMLASAVADNRCPLRKMNPSWNRWSLDIRTSRPLHTHAMNLCVNI